MSFATRAAAKASPSPGALDRYYDDPVGFAADCVDWSTKDATPSGLTPYQADMLGRLQQRRRLVVRGPHTLGKTTSASLAILWFALTRDAAGEDWKIPTTASAWLQLTHYLWPEVHKWARRLRWDHIGRAPFTARELMDLSLKLAHGEAFSASPSDPAVIEGAHADQLLYVYDEAKSISADLFDAAEGAFAGAGPDTHAEAYALAISTPGEPNGRFYELCSAKPGTEDWDRLHVRKDQAIAAGRMSAQWADARARQWGESSAVYQNRVEGEFAAGDSESVIPLAWVEAAQLRWRERHGDHDHEWRAPGPLEMVGVDCSGTGADRTVLALRHGDDIAPLQRPRKTTGGEVDDIGLEEMATSGRVVAMLTGHTQARAVIDAGGLGSGITGRIREKVASDRVVAFVAGAGTLRRDRNGEFGFVDKRSAAWWNLRELLDPEDGAEVALPPEDELVGDLTAPHWREMSGGKIRVESKDDLRKRLRRSTDAGDAVIQAFWVEHGPASIEVPRGHLPSLDPARERSRVGSFALQTGAIRR